MEYNTILHEGQQMLAWIFVTDRSDLEHDIRGAAACLGDDSHRRAYGIVLQYVPICGEICASGMHEQNSVRKLLTAFPPQPWCRYMECGKDGDAGQIGYIITMSHRRRERILFLAFLVPYQCCVNVFHVQLSGVGGVSKPKCILLLLPK